MATVRINVVRLRNSDSSQAAFGKAAPVPLSKPVNAGATITSSGSSQATSITASIKDGDIWDVTVSGGNVWVKAAAAPTAAPDADFLLLDGQTRQFAASVNLEKLAVINA